MKKKFVLILLAILLIAIACFLVFCTDKSEMDDSSAVNPMVPYDTLADAKAAAGFSFLTPTVLPEGYTQSAVYIIDGKVVEVVYTNSEGDQIIYRTAQGNYDISGNYTDYAEQSAVYINGSDIWVKGTSDGIYLAIWTSQGMCYSLQFDEPVSLDMLTQIITSLQ